MYFAAPLQSMTTISSVEIIERSVPPENSLITSHEIRLGSRIEAEVIPTAPAVSIDIPPEYLPPPSYNECVIHKHFV